MKGANPLPFDPVLGYKKKSFPLNTSAVFSPDERELLPSCKTKNRGHDLLRLAEGTREIVMNTLPPIEVENGSLEDEFSLQRGHFPLPGLS